MTYHVGWFSSPKLFYSIKTNIQISSRIIKETYLVEGSPLKYVIKPQQMQTDLLTLGYGRSS